MLAGCGNQTSAPKDSSTTSSRQAQLKATTSHKTPGVTKAPTKDAQKGALAAVKMPKLIWTNEKQYVLDKFVTQWGKTFNPQQLYTNFFPQENATNSYNGFPYPSDLEKNNTAINDHQVNIGVSQDGSKKYDYNVVSIYSNSDGSYQMVDYMYLMTIHNGQPLVVYISQNQPTPDNLMHFYPTKNQQLNAEFTRLVTTDAASEQFKYPTITYAGATFDFRQLNMMAYKFANPDDNLVTYLGTNPLASITQSGPSTYSTQTRDMSKAITVSYD